MSRVGKRIIQVPKGVDIRYEAREIHIKGPKGENRFKVPELVDLEISDDEIKVQADYLGNTKARAMMGTVQACINNMVVGVSEGFSRRLMLEGVGYRATVEGQKLELLLGFSHPVTMKLPPGVQAEVVDMRKIILSSHDNVLLGQTAANIRAFRPPEPFQGKGVLYENERIRRKAGKSGKK
ncbi:MAG: 50S ribosomal protein L6 [bacterium]